MSLLHACDEALTGLAAHGVDVSLVHVDRLIGAVAVGQDSLISWDQLRHLGLGRGAIDHRIKRGLLHRLHPGVFCWGVGVASPRTSARAALYACGRGTAVSHHATCGLLGIRPQPERAIDVTVIGRRVRRAGIRAHRVSYLDRADVRVLGGIAITSPARALLEVANELSPRDLADAVEKAQIKRLITRRDIEATLERGGGRAGVRALRAVIEEPAFTRSRAERMLAALLRAAKLPRPVFNAQAEHFEVDALWRRERVVLEFDSYAFHATKAAQERDRRKTAALQRGRYMVLRTTWHELTNESHALVVRIAEALARATA